VRRRKRSWRIVAATAALVVTGLGVGIYGWLVRSLPAVEGTINVAGLSQPVRIVRDNFAIPHIFATHAHDAYFALGYVHAQDRLWQMEMNRRIAYGRLSELFGSATVSTDRFLRLLDIERRATGDLASLDPTTQDVLEAYARGVNAFLEDPGGPLPPEFLLLRHRPDRWRAVDSLAWGKVMAWNLSGNWRSELLRLRMFAEKGLSGEQIAELYAVEPVDVGSDTANLLAPELEPLRRQLRATTNLALPPGPDTESNGSNAWAVAGPRSSTGKPLLANDPHLGLSAPSIWYFAHIDAPGIEVIGATLPGIPGILLGRTRRVAWGFTNTEADVQDLFVERIAPGDPDSYVTPDGPRRFITRTETIRVRGGDDVELTVRSTRHGPVVGAFPENSRKGVPQPATTPEHMLALSWTGHAPGDTTARAILRLNRASSAGDLIAALEDFTATPQTVVYADADGRFGYHVAGRIPRRGPDNPVRGAMPVPGWEHRYDWTGWIPFDSLPSVADPAAGFVASANHRLVDEDYPHTLTVDWPPPYRYRRIRDLLGETASLDPSAMRALQADTMNGAAEHLLPVLLERISGAVTHDAALKAMRGWNMKMDRDRAEPLIFVAWLRELTRHLFRDDLGPLFDEFWRIRPRLLAETLTRSQHWCDDISTPGAETCGGVLRLAFDAAVADLSTRFGSNQDDWRWGDAHPAVSTHTPLSRHPLLAWLFEIALPSDGDTYSVNAGHYAIADDAAPFHQIHGPSMRAIYNLAHPDESLFVHSTGQSGHPLSPHYRDMARLWQNVDYVAMSMDRTWIDSPPHRTLILSPATTASEKSRDE
jgi:penicillin amidase